MISRDPDKIRLPELPVFKRFSLALRQEYASAGELLATLQRTVSRINTLLDQAEEERRRADRDDEIRGSDVEELVLEGPADAEPVLKALPDDSRKSEAPASSELLELLEDVFDETAKESDSKISADQEVLPESAAAEEDTQFIEGTPGFEILDEPPEELPADFEPAKSKEVSPSEPERDLDDIFPLDEADSLVNSDEIAALIRPEPVQVEKAPPAKPKRKRAKSKQRKAPEIVRVSKHGKPLGLNKAKIKPNAPRKKTTARKPKKSR